MIYIYFTFLYICIQFVYAYYCWHKYIHILNRRIPTLVFPEDLSMKLAAFQESSCSQNCGDSRWCDVRLQGGGGGGRIKRGDVFFFSKNIDVKLRKNMLFYVVFAKFHWNLLLIMLADLCMFFWMRIFFCVSKSSVNGIFLTREGWCLYSPLLGSNFFIYEEKGHFVAWFLNLPTL